MTTIFYRASYDCRRALAREEALSLVAYPDGDNYAYGFGHNDPSIKAGDEITVEQAWKLFADDLAPREKIISRWLKVPVEQHEFDALFHAYYQAGNKVKKVIDRINSGDKPEAMALLLTYNRKKDEETQQLVFHRGLAKRRMREIDMFMKADYGHKIPATFKEAKMKFYRGDPNTTVPEEIDFPPAD